MWSRVKLCKRVMPLLAGLIEFKFRGKKLGESESEVKGIIFILMNKFDRYLQQQ